MTTEKMTIYKALAELKIIDSRIEKAITNGTFCLANKHSDEKEKGVPLKECERSMQGDYDKSTDLINSRNAIKRAVVLSNAVTTANVGSDTYTIAI